MEKWQGLLCDQSSLAPFGWRQKQQKSLNYWQGGDIRAKWADIFCHYKKNNNNNNTTKKLLLQHVQRSAHIVVNILEILQFNMEDCVWNNEIISYFGTLLVA